MLARKNRFHGLGSLRGVYRYGGTVRGPLFGIKYQLNPRRKNFRAAVVVSRKVHKSAVVRNRMRRRLYELVRELEGQISSPYDIVITVYQASLLEATAAQLRGQLKKQLKDAGIIR